MTTNDDLLDATIRHQIGLHRYSTHTLRKVVAMLNRIDPRLRAQIKKYDPATGTGSWSRKRLALLLQAVRDIIDEAYIAITDEVDQSVAGLAGYEAEYQKGMIEHAVPAPIVLDIVTPAAPQLYAAVHSKPFAGMLLKDWYKGLADGTKKRVRDAISQGYVEGRTTDQIIRDLMGTKAAKYADGVLEGSRRGIEAMVRTALNHTATTARNKVYEANQGVIKGVQWVSTLDARTTAVCRGRDGQVYPLDSGPRPPAHINCRSTTIPVLKSWEELGIDLPELSMKTRASMDGQVAADLTYDTWLRRQTVAFQEEILGVKKAKLFRDGELTLDKFIDRKGKEYTLEQLRERESAAWSKAFYSNADQPKPKAPASAGPYREPKTKLEGLDADAREEVLNLGITSGVERLRAFDRNTGETVGRAIGTANQVALPKNLVDYVLRTDVNVALHHNHPGSRSLSMADVRLVEVFPGLSEMWAHGHNGSIFRVQSVKKGAARMYDSVHQTALHAMQSAVNQKFITADDASILHAHVTMLALDRRKELFYLYELTSGMAAAAKRNAAFIDALVEALTKAEGY